MLKLLCVLKVLCKVKQRAKFQHHISMHHAVMRICIFLRLSIICARKWGLLGVLRVKMGKYCLLTPKRHYPAWIRVCWCIACQTQFNGLSSRLVERFCVQRNKKKLSGNFDYMGRSNPWGNLDQMSLVERYGGQNDVCNISWLPCDCVIYCTTKQQILHTWYTKRQCGKVLFLVVCVCLWLTNNSGDKLVD